TGLPLHIPHTESIRAEHKAFTLLRHISYVLSIVNRFNIIHNHDALGDACCVSHTAVYQAPGVMNIHRPLTLRTRVILTPIYLNLHYLSNI
uniref:Uncharacterized protein n=1 Tax=Sinocyclocheilus grahami TaxID=75366 RepID=A0A672Q8B4_SINGR